MGCRRRSALNQKSYDRSLILEPIITYSVKISESEKYQDTFDIYGGTYTPQSPVVIDMQIWNNKYGIESVNDLENFILNFYFENIEDSVFLEYIQVEQGGTQLLPTTIVDRTATVNFIDKVVLSGKANNGGKENTDNYIQLKITFDIPDKTISLKNLDIKSLYFEIVRQ